MELVFLTIIRLYWFLIPESKRRMCIFKKSCSNQVFDETISKGLRVGIRELMFRMKNCHPKFDVFTDYKTGRKKMILKTGVIVDENQIAKRLI